MATGDFVAVQDADLEYDPQDLVRLVEPLKAGLADVVFGSRFLPSGFHRVLYFWHSLGNRFLSLMSNMLTDLNLTDMETCYKVFRRDLIQSLTLQEKRFGFDPEVVAKVAHKRVRIYEAGISYYGRTYAEGKKIGVRDGFRVLYCIMRYNLPGAPWLLQFLFYAGAGLIPALINLICFAVLTGIGLPPFASALIAFGLAAVPNYLLSTAVIFRRNAQWRDPAEWAMYVLVSAAAGLLDAWLATSLIGAGWAPLAGKAAASACCLPLNFLARRYLVFHHPPTADW
jgi:putative flippase GtrA